MTPHLWKSVLTARRGQWACASKRGPLGTNTTLPRIYYPYGDVYYGRTPLEAYNNWRTHNVGSTRS